MNPIDYIESVKERLSTDSIVVSFDIIREFSNLNEGFIRARINLTNGDILDFSELTKQANDLELVSYRYQWLDRNKKTYAGGTTPCIIHNLKTSRITSTSGKMKSRLARL